MKTHMASQPEGNTLKDLTKENCPQSPHKDYHNSVIKLSNTNNQLSDFAKTIIRECAEQPKNSIYKTYTQIMRFCSSSRYTIKQVGKYLRKVRKKAIKESLNESVNNYQQNIPYINYLINYQLSKTDKKQNNTLQTKARGFLFD